jgi:hypothetical protein
MANRHTVFMRVKDDRGSAVLLALIAMVLLTALGEGLIVLSNTETTIAANFHASAGTLYAADAAAERAVGEIRHVPQWTDILSGAVRSTFVDATRTPRLTSGETINLDALTRDLQARSNAAASWGPNNPAWRLFAYGPLTRLAGGMESGAYVIVWVADDPAEVDGVAAADSNGVLMIRADALGPHRTRRAVSVTVARPASGDEGSGTSHAKVLEGRDGAGRADGMLEPRVLSWREVR